MKRIVLFLCAFSLLVAGCSGKSSVSGSNSGALSPQAGTADDTPKKFLPRHKPADHQVIVMLGPEYASRPAVLDAITAEYGLAGYGGMLVSLLYPDSFKDGKRTRLSVLTDRASEVGVTIIVTVGAPEGTVIECNKIHASKPDIKIVNLFPLDDALPVEAISSLVADYPSPKEILANENDTSAGNATSGSGAADDASLGLLILASTLAEEGTSADSPQARLSAALETARGLMKLKKTDVPWHLSLWVDPDTGLKSHNHLVLEYKRSGAE